jgi:DNA-directed RNA polymerase subunit RPC12/RpoP
MDLIFNCPKCGQELEVDASGAGEEITCPSCSETIRIPDDRRVPAPGAAAGPAPATGAWAAMAQAAAPAATSAAAKVEMHLKVPVRSTPGESLIAKPPAPLEAAARSSDRQLHVKCIRHIDCVEVGHDRFDDTVTQFLGKIGEANMVSMTTISYSHIDISSQKLLTDFGVMIVYRA